jgi:hypothetical protein
VVVPQGADCALAEWQAEKRGRQRCHSPSAASPKGWLDGIAAEPANPFQSARVEEVTMTPLTKEWFEEWREPGEFYSAANKELAVLYSSGGKFNPPQYLRDAYLGGR